MEKFQIPEKEGHEDERSVDLDDDFQDPPPKQINKFSLKKQTVDSSTPKVKKSVRKRSHNIIDEHTQKRTPVRRAVKVVRVTTQVFKTIQTRQATAPKMKNVKQTTRVIFPPLQSKQKSPVEKEAVTS
ncbi:hypothetical protein FXO38_05842 [Capsicum annuum]|nr:hypothetical protein FXO38_05842 [Capsicum annuum]